jgi:hypothetical protein
MTCEQCGGEYAPRVPKRGPISKYCSVKCRREYATRKVAFPCIACGAPVQSSNRSRRYCDACRNVARHVEAGTRRDFPEKPCAQCGKAFKPSTKATRFCGRDCLQAHNIATQGVGPHVCLECGSSFKHRLSSRQANRYCSRACADKASKDRERASGRRTEIPCIPKGAHHEDRARVYGGAVERVDVMAVFERCGWMCGICQQPVDRFLSWPDPMSPSLDHITPLSKGGGHTEGNTQCAHLRCNSAKRDRVAA